MRESIFGDFSPKIHSNSNFVKIDKKNTKSKPFGRLQIAELKKTPGLVEEEKAKNLQKKMKKVKKFLKKC